MYLQLLQNQGLNWFSFDIFYSKEKDQLGQIQIKCFGFFSVSGKDAPELSTIGVTDRAVEMDVQKCFFQDCEIPIDPDTVPPVTKR